MSSIPSTVDSVKKIFICGHRNPDVDSVAAAYALAELKHALNEPRAVALCAGKMPPRAAFLFEKFKTTPPESRNDIHLRLADIMHTHFTSLPGEMSLFDAVGQLRADAAGELPVTDEAGRCLGLVSPFSMISELLNTETGEEGSGFTGRKVHSSFKMIREILNAELLSGDPDDAELRSFDVFVAAMSADYFCRHLDRMGGDPAIIVGDRPEIHLRVLQRKIRLIIITGECPVEESVVELARLKKVTLLRTKLDSASVIRRLKFAVPLKAARLTPLSQELHPDDPLRDVVADLKKTRRAVFPVCGEDGRIAGVIFRSDLSSPPPYKLILVDYNETGQGIPGEEEVPVLEIVDHHRIGMRPTVEPVKITADAVGSTCTLVAGMYRTAGLRPRKNVAGILLGGIVTDTLCYQSPTTTASDRAIGEWLEKLSGATSGELMQELMRISSPLAAGSAETIIQSDKKCYDADGYHFALSQIEDTKLEHLHRRREELEREMTAICAAENLDFLGLMVSDLVRANSELLLVGDRHIRHAIPQRRRPDGIFELPGMLSRKKQLLPQILALTAANPKKNG